MKNKIIKPTSFIVLVLIVIMTISIPVFAAGEQYYSINTSTSWKKIAEASSGFGCNVYIECTNFSNVPCDIRMLDANGGLVWEESGAISINSIFGSGGNGSRTFWCGSNVYQIQIRTQGGTGTAFALHQG